MFRTVICAGLLSLAAMSAQSASAADRAPSQVRVNLNKVDFSKPEQAKFAYAKLEAAAKMVCDSEVYDPVTANDDKACEDQAVRQALAQASEPTLEQLAERSTTAEDDATDADAAVASGSR